MSCFVSAQNGKHNYCDYYSRLGEPKAENFCRLKQKYPQVKYEIFKDFNEFLENDDEFETVYNATKQGKWDQIYPLMTKFLKQPSYFEKIKNYLLENYEKDFSDNSGKIAEFINSDSFNGEKFLQPSSLLLNFRFFVDEHQQRPTTRRPEYERIEHSTRRLYTINHAHKSLCDYLNYWFPSSQLVVREFTDYLYDEIDDPQQYDSFKTIPHEFYSIDNQLMRDFVKKYKKSHLPEKVKTFVKNENFNKQFALLEKSRMFDAVNVEMIFTPLKLDNYISENVEKFLQQQELSSAVKNLENHLNRNFPNALKSNKELISFLMGSRATAEEINELKKDPEEFFEMKNQLLTRFVQNNQLELVLDTLSDISEENSWKNVAKLKKAGVFNQISIEMMFTPSKMNKFLQSELAKLNRIEETSGISERLSNHLRDIFKNNTSVTDEFVKFLINKRASADLFSKFMLTSDEFNNLESGILREFVESQKTKRVNEALQDFDPQKIEENTSLLENAEAFDEITTKMIFNAKEMSNFIQKYLENCDKKVKKMLSSSVNYSSPQNCILKEICTKMTMGNWNETIVREKIAIYSKNNVEEIDEMFSNFLDDHFMSDDLNFEGEKKCVRAFLQRDHESSQLIKDSDDYADVVEKILSKYTNMYLQK